MISAYSYALVYKLSRLTRYAPRYSNQILHIRCAIIGTLNSAGRKDISFVLPAILPYLIEIGRGCRTLVKNDEAM